MIMTRKGGLVCVRIITNLYAGFIYFYYTSDCFTAYPDAKFV